MDVGASRLIQDTNEIQRKLEDNKRVLSESGELMASVSAFLNQSPEFEPYFHQLQMKIAKILGDDEKITNPELLETTKASYVKPEYAHVTLVGNLLTDWNQRDKAGENLQETIKTVAKTSLTSIGPHLTEGLSVIYQLAANDDQLTGLRQKSKDWYKKYNEKAYLPPIFHASVVYFKEATQKQLKEIYQVLQNIREKGAQYTVPVNYVNLSQGKTNRTFVDVGSQYELSDVGGIDLTRDKLGLQVQNARQGVQFKFNPAMINQLQIASGLNTYYH